MRLHLYGRIFIPGVRFHAVRNVRGSASVRGSITVSSRSSRQNPDALAALLRLINLGRGIIGTVTTHFSEIGLTEARFTRTTDASSQSG